MPSVDNRVVEMRFDNKNFETNVDESISTLDRLKKALHFGSEDASGLEEIGKAAEAVSQKFSILGTIADQFLRNIGNSIYEVKNQFVGLVKSMSTDQISAGMTKYEQKTASVQTILNATEKSLDEVNEYLERLMTYSDETSFGFTDMTTALQTMTASGGDLEKLVPMLMGMGNAVAYAGKGASEFSRVMTYGLNQAYSLGYLGTKDWMSFAGAGVNSKQLQQTFLDVLREQKKGDYTLEQFSEALTKKVIDKEVMEEAIGRWASVTLEAERLVNEGRYETFSEAYDYLKDTDFAKMYGGIAYNAARAAQEAKTFREAIDATKDAVSSGWMTTFEHLIGNYEKAKVNWTWLANELWEVFASGGQERNNMLAAWSEAGGYDKLWQSIKNLWDGLRGIGGRFKAVWKQLFPGVDTQKLLDITDKLYDFSVKFRDRFAEVEESVEAVANTIGNGITHIKDFYGRFLTDKAPGEAVDEIGELNDTIDDHIVRLARTIAALDTLVALVNGGKYSVGDERRRLLEEEGYDYELVQNAVNELYNSNYRYEKSEEDLAAANELVNNGLLDEAGNLKAVSRETHKATESALEARTWVDDLRDVLGGLRSALDLIVEGGKLAAKYLVIPAWNFLVDTFKKVLAVIAPFSRAFSDFVNRLKESKSITKSIEKISRWFRDLKENLKGQENIQKFIGYFGELKDKLSGFKESALDRVNEFFDRIVHLDENLNLPDVSIVGDWIDGVVGYVNAGIESLKEFREIWPKIKSFFKGLDFSSAKNFGKTAGEGLSEFFKGLFKDVDLIEIGKKIFTGILKGIFDIIKSIEWGTLLNAAFKGSLIVSLTSIGYSISKFFLRLSSFGEGSLGILESLGNILHNLGLTLKTTAVLEIAVAIGILAGSLVALSLIPTSKLYDVTAVMLVIIVALGLLFKSLNSSSKTTNFGTIMKNILGFSAIIISLGYFLGKLSVAMLEIAAIITVFSFIKTDKLFLSILAVTSILGILFVFILSLSKLPLANIGKLLIFTIGLTILGAALTLLIPTILTFSALSVGNLAKSILSIGAILAIFALISKIVTDAKSILALSVGFLAFAVAIALFTPALIALTAVIGATKWYNILIAVGAIVVLLYAFTGVIAILSNIGAKQGKLEKGIWAMFALAIGIASIGAVLYVLKDLKFKQMIGSVGAILILVAGLSLIAGVIGAIDSKIPIIEKGLKILSIVLLSLAGVFALTAVSVLAFAKAFEILSRESVDAKKAGKNLAEGVIAFFDELVANGRSIIEFIEMVVMSIISILIIYKSDIVNTGAKILDALGAKVLEGIAGSQGKMIIALAIVIAAVLSFLGISLEDAAIALFSLIGLLINGLAKAVLTTGSVVFQAIMNLADAIATTFIKALESAFSDKFNQSAIGKFLSSLSDENLDKFTESLGLGKWSDSIFSKTISKAAWYISPEEYEKMTDIEELNKRIDSTSSDLTSHLNDSVGNIKSSAREYADGLISSGNTIESGFLAFKDKIMSAKDSVDINGEIIEGKQLYHLKKGLMDNEITAENYGSYISESLYNSFETGLASTKVDFSFDSIFDGLLSNAFNSESTDLTSLKSLVYDGTYDLGGFADQGLADGMTDELWQALASAKGVSVETIKEMYNAAESNSPSKATERLGGYLIDGLVIGMKSKTLDLIKIARLIINAITTSFSNSEEWIKLTSELKVKFYTSFKTAAEDITSDVLDAFNSVIARISDAIDGDFDMSPVIRPVLDLSEIQNGSARIGSILGMNTGYAFNPNLSYGMIGANDVVAAAGQMSLKDSNLDESLMMLRLNMNQINNDNKTIINVMSRYLPYIPEFAHMQVTLDKKTLVGQLTPAINAKLGDIALAKR